MKTLKFQPGTFLEMDDLAGGRKVVVVGRDGSTYWDMLDAERVTPVVIHPSQHAVALGSLAEFARARGLQDKIEGLMLFLREQDLNPEGDPLLAMRTLWEFSLRSDSATPEADLFAAACRAAQAQGAGALRIHARAEQYCAQ
ncbi:hypothetical protein [Castellaniella sp.]|uniref:hypothetical protein n=1 Tax=Castellaniella sp. TaxID=1955812 RepID=UPI002AFE6728|nr:hypothetical protein [Castellaniella sp.]